MGHCHQYEEESILVAIVTEFYRCTNCGADPTQHVTGKIRYIQLTDADKEWLRKNADNKNQYWNSKKNK